MATTLVVNSGAKENNKWFPSTDSGSYFGWTGEWGSWGAIQYCPQNSKAVGFTLQVGDFENSPRIDYVGLNSMCLICERGGLVCSRKGTCCTSPRRKWKFTGYGQKIDYSSVTKMKKNCTDGFTEAAFKWKDKVDLGLGDDSAGIEVQLVCGETPQGGTREWFSSGSYSGYRGSRWLTYKKCPKGTRICGLQTQVESWDDTDNTGLNGVWFTCCAQVEEVHADGRVEMTDGTFCEKYSQKACEVAIKLKGLAKGGKTWNFAGNYGTKGCYAYSHGRYAGHAYYGTGGTESQMATMDIKSNQFRPDGYDCQNIF